MTTHQQSTIDQFTRQAVHFSQMPGHNDEESLGLLIAAAGLSEGDTVLDVACGSGIVACAFAEIAAHVTGIDITPAMLEQAASLAATRDLKNLSWHQGDIETLPFPDDSFSVVLSRYAFHHFLHPHRVLFEMVRVCHSGGRILVVDAVLPDDQVEAYNQFEKLLDPSHSSALTFTELNRLVKDAGLKNVELQFYRMEMELEQQLATSFPNPGDDKKVRDLVRGDIGIDRLGIGAHLRGEKIHYTYPVTVLVGVKS
ncbi:MAG: methyltransferase domain-containing protein [Acidobacteriota bacterium]